MPGGDTIELRTILATTDFSDQASAGVELAASLARRLEARLLLLFVVTDDLPPLLVGISEKEREEILEEHRVAATARLADYAREQLPGVEVETITEVGVPSRRIVEVAQQRGADLVVIASRGYGPLRQILLGSTAERVLHRAPCPVLVAPSRSS
jgi:universal stress protein A